MSLIERCRQFIGIDTSPEAGTLEGGLWLKALGQELGFSVDFQEELFHDRRQANVFFRLQERTNSEFLLQSHFDTINPGPSFLWRETMLNPFQAVMKEGRLYGLGACEPKIDLLCKMEALFQMKDRGPWKKTPVVGAIYGGEIGMHGLLRAIRKNKFSPSMALVGEPSSGQLIYAGKGYAVLEMEIPFSGPEQKYRRDHDLQESVRTQSKIFKGTPAHSSAPANHENAINKALEYLWQIPEGVVLMEIDGGVNHNTIADNVVLEFDLAGGVKDTMVSKLKFIYRSFQRLQSEFLTQRDVDFQTPHPTLNLGLISTCEDHVRLIFSVRLPPSVTEDQSEQWFKTLQEDSTFVGGQCRMLDYKRAYRTDLESDFVKICEGVLSSSGGPSSKVAHPACTEMALLSRRGVECLGFGAGTRKENLSAASDSISFKEINWSVDFYRSLIEKVCL